MDKKKNIVLIGFMGTGKTAVGTRLAARLGREFVDTDKEVEKVTGLAVRDIFLKHGQTRFRSEEALIVQKLAAGKGLVIATGGGSIINPENLTLLKEDGILVCLQAEPEEILRRVNKKRHTRPLIKKSMTAEDILELLRERQEYYDNADLFVDTSRLEPDEIVNKILQKLNER
ncbi:MAG: shikimate kinase [Syntrophomonadaceae bacterium]|nr:shikimate kinase [Syntrophomonadaceae bacterium]